MHITETVALLICCITKFTLRETMRRKKTSLTAFILVLTILASAMLFPMNEIKAVSPAKTVYVVIVIDTEMSSGHTVYLGTTNPNPTFDMSEYALSPPGQISQVYNTAFRNNHLDSFGDTFKMTWFAEMDYVFSQANFVYSSGATAGVSGYTSTMDLLLKNFGAQFQAYGDAIEYHHHFVTYNGTWQRYDNGPDASYPGYQEIALDHMIIDRGFYPTSFRSGWDIDPPALENWIEKWFPFDYTPVGGSTYPYQSPGLNHWIQNCYDTLADGQIDLCFQRANNSGSSIYSFYCHDNTNMAATIDQLQQYLGAEQAMYPDVSFKYVTAQQAMQQALGYTDTTAPTFTVSLNSGVYTILSSEPLWGNHPYIALKYANGTYTRVDSTPVGTNTWTVKPSGNGLTTVGIAANDLSGNPGVWDGILSPTISPTPTPTPSPTPTYIQIPVVSATASSYNGITYGPQNAIDGIESTSNFWGTWAGLGLPQWLQLDLGSAKSVNQVVTHFYDGDGRVYTYNIQVSSDGSSWSTVVPSKTGSSIVTDAFPSVTCRYVRITVTGNTANTAAHIEEIKVFQDNGTPTPTPSPTPTPTPTPSATPTPAPTATPSPTPSPSPSPTPTPTSTPTPIPTSSPTPTSTPSPTPTPTAKPTPTPTPFPTPTPTSTPTPIPTSSPTPTSTPSPTPTPTAKPTPTPTPFPTPTPTSTPTPIPTSSPTPTSTPSPTPTPIAKPTPTPTPFPTSTPTASPTPTPTPTPTATPTPTPTPSSPPTHIQIPVVSATASSYNGITYGPQNAIDGIESTSNFWGTWAGLGLPQWLQLDLGSAKNISQIVTHFYDGDPRTYTYNIQISTDGLTWSTIVATKTGNGIVTDVFPQVTARYVRINITANTANTAAHIEEIKVYQ